jgi:hypothetical protein
MQITGISPPICATIQPRIETPSQVLETTSPMSETPSSTRESSCSMSVLGKWACLLRPRM